MSRFDPDSPPFLNPGTSLVGIDMAPELREHRNRFIVPIIASAIVAALLLVGLRIDLIRMQYAVAEASSIEQELLDEKQALTVEMRRLRDPSRLVERASALGFERPQRVIDLPASPTPGVAARGAETSSLR